MKKLIGLFLILSLNTGCGLLKHSNKTTAKADTKGNTKSANASTSHVRSNAVLNFTNLSATPREWIARSGEKFMLIGEFNPNDSSALLRARTDTPVLAGSIRATWAISTYVSHDEGQNPKPTKSENAVDYPQIPVYFAQTVDSQNVFAVVPEGLYGALAPVSEPIEVSYHDQVVCTTVALSGAFGSDAADFSFSIPVDGIQASCTVTNCTYEVFQGVPQNLSYTDLMNRFPASRCTQNASLPTQHASMQNTASVTSYQINLGYEFETTAANVQFKAPGQN